MRNLLNFLVRYNHVIVFIILEGIAFYLLVNGNNYHNSVVVKGVHAVTLGVEERISELRTYLDLRRINSNLAAENDVLRNTLRRFTSKDENVFHPFTDTIYKQQYNYIPAEVINNSVNRQKNYFTLNKGKRHGLTVDMAVSENGNAAGIIVGCSENYSVAISLLNLDFRVSSRIRSNGYFGSLTWDGHNPTHAVLNEIPQHINITIGDTVETTGYSAIFPEGMLIGRVSDMKKSGSDFYGISVELFTDFRNIHYVSVIGNIKKAEQRMLEKQFQ